MHVPERARVRKVGLDAAATLETLARVLERWCARVQAGRVSQPLVRGFEAVSTLEVTVSGRDRDVELLLLLALEQREAPSDRAQVSK